MDITTFLAQLWGIYYLVFGILFLFRGQLGKTIALTSDKSFIIGTGYTTFFLGLITIILHNIWVSDWRVVITILGWVTFLKGIQKIGFPENIQKGAQKFKHAQKFAGIFMIVVGGYLLWNSFL